MKVQVDAELCVGTGSCEALCPEIFTVNEEGVAVVKAADVPPEHEAAAREAIENCPVNAIREV